MPVERVVESPVRPRLATGVLSLRWRRLDRARSLRGMVDCPTFRSALPKRSQADGRLDLLCGFPYSVVQCWQDETMNDLGCLPWIMRRKFVPIGLWSGAVHPCRHRKDRGV